MLAVTGGALALFKPGMDAGHLGEQARQLFVAIGRAVLDGSLPAEPSRRAAALDALPQRIEALIGQLPPHAQDELSSLIALLVSSPGRKIFAGLSRPWPEASTPEIQACLQGMRISRVALRRQTYQGLHDVVGGAYFSDPSTWPMLGYPGPGVAFT